MRRGRTQKRKSFKLWLWTPLFTAHEELTPSIFFSLAQKPSRDSVIRENIIWEALWNCLSFMEHLWAITGKCVKLLNQCFTEVEGVCLDALQLPGQFNGRTARFKESARKTEAQWRDNDVPWLHASPHAVSQTVLWGTPRECLGTVETDGFLIT